MLSRRPDANKPALLAGLCDALRPLGFSCRGQDFKRDGPNGTTQSILACVGRDKPTGITTVIVSVGVRHERVEKLVMGWRDDLSRQTKREAATVGGEIGVIDRDETKIWTLTELDEVPVVVQDMTREITRVGLPYLEKFSDLHEVLKSLEDGDRRLNGQFAGSRAQRLPVAVALVRGVESAIPVIREQQRLLLDQDDPIAEKYPVFVRYLAEHLDPRLGCESEG